MAGPAPLTLNAARQAAGPQPAAQPAPSAPSLPAPGSVYWGPSGGVWGGAASPMSGGR
jgi:hypothetical protein